MVADTTRACPLCGREKPSHQPICFACATDNARVTEAMQKGLLGLPVNKEKSR